MWDTDYSIRNEELYSSNTTIDTPVHCAYILPLDWVLEEKSNSTTDHLGIRKNIPTLLRMSWECVEILRVLDPCGAVKEFYTVGANERGVPAISNKLAG